MKLNAACILFMFLSISLGAAPYSDPVIDTVQNKIIGSEFLQPAMNKLVSIKRDTTSRFVTVHFGDSHIQGDNFSGTIRTNLQSEFGDGGEGVLFPYSLCKSFGPKSLTSSSTGMWTWATVLKNPDHQTIGVTGYSLITKDTSSTLTFTYIPEVTAGAPNKTYEIIVWHGGDNSKIALNNPRAGLELIPDTTDYGSGLHRTIVRGYRSGEKISFRVKKSPVKKAFTFLFYGVMFRNAATSGVEYHRCGVVGATFLQLIAQQEFTIEHLRCLQPDLLIFSYGSNESYNGNLNMQSYAATVNAFIARLKTEFPGIGIIITSPPDTRSQNRFPINTLPITDSLQVISNRNACGFWDLHGIMGGDNSIYYWLNNGLARKDKLHFTKSGYELQGNLFSLAFLNAFRENDPSRKIETYDTVNGKIQVQLNQLSAQKSGTPSGEEKSQTHTVKKGETLSIIARNYNVTVDQLCEWNNVKKTDVLRIGQVIIIKK